MYLNVKEIESALRALANTYANTCTLVDLPHKTHEGRTVYALHIGRRDSHKLGGVFVTGGVHAREWGTVDICVNFAADLLEAYAVGAGLAYGAVSFSASDFKSIVDGLDVIVLACANPDGRAHDMSGVTDLSGSSDGEIWRKNRRKNQGTTCVGADPNRNQDILWETDRYLHPTAASRASSPNPCSDVYRGPAAGSEPEARNIVWILDAFPGISHYMDIHCYTGTVLFPWGHAPNQSNNPGMNFRNPAYDRQRGLPQGPYGEYIQSAHEMSMRYMAEHVASTINKVRGLVNRKYVSGQSFYLDVGQSGEVVTYPTTGTNDDYAYSRHIVDPLKPLVQGFTMEFNLNEDFYPPWSEMASEHIPDACAGLLAFCLQAFKSSFPRIDLPQVFGQILGGIDVGGGGILILPSGKVIKVPPRQDRLLQALEVWGTYLIAQELGPELGRGLALAALETLGAIIAAEQARFV